VTAHGPKPCSAQTVAGKLKEKQATPAAARRPPTATDSL
jgi:hypothetical protein